MAKRNRISFSGLIGLKTRIFASVLCGIAGLILAPSSAFALLAPTTTTVTASPNPVPSGASVTFTATATSGAGTPDGQVLFLSDVLSLGVATLNGSGQATFTATTLPVGVHAIVAVYLGNLNYLTSTSIGVTLNVNLAPCTLTVAASTNLLSLGTPLNLTATVGAGSSTAAPTGAVTFSQAGTVLGTASLTSGQAMLSLSALPIGALAVTASYSGDTNFLGCLAPIITITVNKGSTTTAVSSSLNPGTFGSPVTFTASVTGSGATPTGSVSFMDGAGVIGTGTLNGGGQATFATASLGVGSHSITAVYAGDTNLTGSTSPALAQVVNQGTSTTSVGTSGTPAALGAPVTFTATVTGSGGSPTGGVTFKDGVNTLGTGTLNGSGQATFATSALALGSHSITAVYGGDTSFASSTSATVAQVIVQGASSSTLASSANPSAAGAAVTFTATVTGAGGTPSGTVTLKDGATAIGSTTLDGTGHATFSISSLAAGSHSLTAAYSGDPNFASSTSPVLTQTVNPVTSTTSMTATPNPVALGAPVTFAATVTGTGGTPTGLVTFKDGATTIGSAAVDGTGHASLAISSLASGAHSITAVYGGDATFGASTSPAIALQVNSSGATASTTGLTATPNPVTAGAPVTFTAAVTGSGGTPTGTVTFKDGATTIGTVPLDGTGHASFATSSLGTGNHTITAVYNGDSTYAASTSPGLSLSVNPGGGGGGGTTTTTSLSSSADPSVARQPVIFTALVAGGGGTPTGTVTFKDGSVTLGAATLAAGSASLTVASLIAGTHTITAAYGGDATFAASTSAPLSQSVSIPPDSVKLRDMQIEATAVVAQTSGAAISGAIDSAISEGFSDGGELITPSDLGLRLSSSGYDQPKNGAVRADWMIWSDLRHTGFNTQPSSGALSGDQVNALAGITRRLTPDFLVGIFGGYESFTYGDVSLDGHLHGSGWTAGGYVGWRFLPGMRFDAGFAQSLIDYNAAAGTATGSFTGSRSLVTSGLTGNYYFTPEWEFEPSARVYALWEKEGVYTDSLGTQQAANDFSSGRASVGAKLIYRWVYANATFAPYAGIYADDYFNKSDATAIAALPASAMQGLSARLVGGVAITTDYGIKFTTAGEFGGIGSGTFTNWSLRARGAVPF
jgi:hypothetical protein